MLAPDDKGVSLRETLEGLLKRARTADRKVELEAQLALPEFPAELEYLWSDYLRLRGRKGSSGWGLLPLEWPDFQAFMYVFSRRYDRWEVATLEAIDRVYMTEMNRTKAADSPTTT